MKKVSIPDADLVIDFVMQPTAGSIAPTMSRYEFVKTKSHFNIKDMIIRYDKKTLSHRFLVPAITKMWKSSIIDRFEVGVEQALDKSLQALGQNVTKILNQTPNPLSISTITSLIPTIV